MAQREQVFVPDDRKEIWLDLRVKLKARTGPNALRTSGMLLGFSVFMLVAGVVRMTLLVATYHGSGGDEETFPKAVLLSAAVVEGIVGFVGLLRALAVIMFDYHNAEVTRFSVILMLFGWFTLVTFVFAEPAYRVNHTEKPEIGGLNMDQYEGIVTLGVLGSLAYCCALQGGQFFFAWQLWNIEKGTGLTYTIGYYSVRLAFYSVLALIAGLSQLAIGTFVWEELGKGRLTRHAGVYESIGAPPCFIVYPELNVAAGLLVIIAALTGLERAVFPSRRGRVFFSGLWLLTWLVQIVFMAVTQLGLWHDSTLLERRQVVFVSGHLVVLTLSLSIVPPYLDAMLYHSETVHQTDEHGTPL